MKNKKALIGMAVLFLAIGFAAVSTTLIVNGILALGESDDFEIIFTSAKLDGRKRNDFISSDKKHIEFTSNTLTDIDDETKLVYEVTNTSRNYDANVSVRCTSGENEYIMFNYTPLEMRVLASETKSGTLTASMLKVTDVERDIPIECELIATPTERESVGDEYIEPFSRSGVLKQTTTQKLGYLNDVPIGDFWDYREEITKVVFEDKMIEHETIDELKGDVSAASDGSVLYYLVPTEEDDTKYILYIQSESGVKANPNSSYLFASFKNLKEIEGIEYFDTSNVTSMAWMFNNCTSIEVIDVSEFDTSKVTSMYGMFMVGDGTSSVTRKLKEIKGIENFDVSSVTNMARMFTSCTNLTTLDLNSWDVSNLKRAEHMFSFCSNLTYLNISKWVTSNVTSMAAMFWGCRALTSIEVNNWDVSNVTAIDSIFNMCSSLRKLDLNNWNTSSIINMSTMFFDCVNLIELQVGKWDTRSVTSFSSAFYNCQNLTTVDVGNWDMSNAANVNRMFKCCLNLRKLDLSKWDTSSFKNIEGMFWECSALEELDVSNWNTSNVENMEGVFAYCEKLSTIAVDNWNTSNVENMGSVFAYCSGLLSLNVSMWNTGKAMTMRAMFANCVELENLDLENFDTTNVVNMQAFVAGCHNLTATITIRGTNCTEYTQTPGWSNIFESVAIYTGTKITVNYTADASSLVDEMIGTKSETSNVIKGIEVL